MEYEEKTISKKEVYKGNIINVEKWQVLLPNGKEASRDIVIHPGASVIIPLTENNELYMVRQYRKPVDAELLELPAGKLDEEEDPEVCAKRELKEETGLDADELKHVLSVNSTPGFSNEVLYIYLATGLHEGTACTDEDEFLRIEKVPVKKLLDMILNHEITDAKTIIGILLADRIIKGEMKI
ncbi:MAG: NUDIX hydrolase [Clostridium sp.]|jgi:ADP-ribose pyrophosphatase|nr:NUDIX hydrolase [Clostridium sp.]